MSSLVPRLVPLDAVASARSGGTPSRRRPHYFNGHVPWAKIEDLTRAGMWIDSTDEHVSEAALEETPARLFPAGTVLLAMYGSIGTASIAKVAMATNQAILGIECGPELDPEYLWYWLQRSRRSLVASGRGGTQANINAQIVRALRIPLPRPDEQRVIVRRLTRQRTSCQCALEASRNRRAGLGSLRAALLRDAFKGIIPLTAGAAREAAPRGWRWRALSTVARLESGHTPSRFHPEWWGGDIPWLALPDIRALDGKVAYDTAECTNEAGIANSSARVLPTGTVCLSRTASVGFVTILGRPMATSQDFVNWICGPELDPSFLAYLLRTSRTYIRSVSSGAVHKTVYVPTVKAFEVCLPDRRTQEAIAGSLTKQLRALEFIDGAAQEEVELLERMPAALLRAALDGEE